MLSRVPGGDLLEEAYHRLGEITKAAIEHNHMFEHFGLVCIGPTDGHDIHAGLIEMLTELKTIEQPMLLHVKTTKGKGFEFAEGDATTFHSPKPFVISGCRAELKKSSGRAFTAAYADALIDLMERMTRSPLSPPACLMARG
jgi:1-deoxy-D-xylulose-5-phosphate synthase